MELHVELAQAVAALGELEKLCEPSAVSHWTPTQAQLASYIAKSEQVLEAVSRLRTHESRAVLTQGQIQDYVPGPLLCAIREKLVPCEQNLWAALEYLDPDNQPFRDFCFGIASQRRGRELWSTFNEGLAQIQNLIDRNAGEGYEERFSLDEADEILESRLIKFDPDAWKDRALTLRPVRLGRVNLVLPGQLRIRLEEIHRTFVFGCWISVISLSRAALEYALHDNAKRLDVATIWPTDRDGKARSKRLTDLIDDYKNIIPTIAENLATIRDLGNKYMHPKAGKSGRLDLDDLQQDCSTIIYAIGTTIEGIYLHGREA
jgi:hypothetical protein